MRWPFGRSLLSPYIQIPVTTQRGTWRGRDVLLVRDRYARFVDALMVCDGSDVEMYVKYRYRRAVETG